MTVTKKDVEQVAAGLARVNPAAFPTAVHALKSIRRDLAYIRRSKTVVSTATGGYILTKDSDGDVQLWVMAQFAFKAVAL